MTDLLGYILVSFGFFVFIVTTGNLLQTIRVLFSKKEIPFKNIFITFLCLLLFLGCLLIADINGLLVDQNTYNGR